MTRSRKSVPVVSVACVGRGEMARHKRARAKTERARVRDGLANLDTPEEGDKLGEELAPWDEWACPRDGKQEIPPNASEADRRRALRK